MKKVISILLSIVTVFSIGILSTGCAVKDWIDSEFDEIFDELESLEKVEVSENDSTQGGTVDKDSTQGGIVNDENAPDKIVILDGETEYETLSWYKVEEGKTYNLKLDLRNAINDVGDEYGTYEIVEISMSGKFLVNKNTIENGTVTETVEDVVDLGYGNWVNDSYAQIGETKIYPDYFLTASITEDVLTINALKSEKSFKFPNTEVKNGVQYTYKGAYYDPRGGGVPQNCSWCIVVEEVASGKRILLQIDY